MKTSLKYLFLAAAIAASAGVANAVPTLRVVTGTDVLKVADNNSLGTDLSALAGTVDWNGIFDGWNIKVDIGTVSGTLGSPSLSLQFNAINTTGSSAPLWLYFANDGLGPTQNGVVNASVSGDASGSVSYWASLTDVTGTTDLTSKGPFSGPSFSGSSSSAAFSSNLYKLVGTIEITGQSADGTLVLDDPAPVPDSGTTLMLLGAGLTGLGLVSRLRRRLS
jgi:VPDSG-CTERM motif